MKIIAKGSQNGTEIDAKTHQKSMPELLSKKIKEIIKNHVSLKSEIIEIQGLTGVPASGKERRLVCVKGYCNRTLDYIRFSFDSLREGQM